MSGIDDYTIADAQSNGFGLLELYKLWHRNHCFSQPPTHDKMDEIIRAAQRELDERYQLLPLDADGRAIHIGDEMIDDGGNVFTVDGIGLFEGRDVVYYTTDSDRCDGHLTSVCHHYHKPTVEELLRRFGSMYGAVNIDDIDSLVAEYAERLQLKEDK